jgi:hypothetical protein
VFSKKIAHQNMPGRDSPLFYFQRCEIGKNISSLLSAHSNQPYSRPASTDTNENDREQTITHSASAPHIGRFAKTCRHRKPGILHFPPDWL